MQDEFTNRQSMHRTVLGTLDKAVWENQPPQIFTTRVADFRVIVADLETLIQAQSANITGSAEQKQREEAELEGIAYETGQLLAIFCEDTGDETMAAEVDFSLSTWQRLRHEDLLARARLVHNRLTQCLTTSGTELANYGLTDADAALLQKETDDFAAIIAAPSTAIAGRKALTSAPASETPAKFSRNSTNSPSASAAPNQAEPSPTHGMPQESSATLEVVRHQKRAMRDNFKLSSVPEQHTCFGNSPFIRFPGATGPWKKY